MIERIRNAIARDQFWTWYEEYRAHGIGSNSPAHDPVYFWNWQWVRS